MRRIHLGLLLSVLTMSLWMLTACEKNTEETPQLKVTAGKTELQVLDFGQQGDPTREEMEEVLQKAVTGTGWEQIPYLALHTAITFEPVGYQHKQLDMKDYLLTKEGSFRYGEKSEVTTTLQLEKGIATYELAVNPFVFASSNSNDYLPGNTVRCFVLRAPSGKLGRTFAFIVRTDAS